MNIMYIKKLASVASSPLVATSPEGRFDTLPHYDKVAELLSARNGFFAFESALHVFPMGGVGDTWNLEAWNSRHLWRGEYPDISENVLFFAEDVFGYQFCVDGDGVALFNPENSSFEFVASTLDEWARLVLEDPDAMIGYAYAHEWQVRNGWLANNRRLICKIPLILGGDLSMDNIGEIDAVEGMRVRGYMWSQIKDLPDGTKVNIKIVD